MTDPQDLRQGNPDLEADLELEPLASQNTSNISSQNVTYSGPETVVANPGTVSASDAFVNSAQSSTVYAQAGTVLAQDLQSGSLADSPPMRAKTPPSPIHVTDHSPGNGYHPSTNTSSYSGATQEATMIDPNHSHHQSEYGNGTAPHAQASMDEEAVDEEATLLRSRWGQYYGEASSSSPVEYPVEMVMDGRYWTKWLEPGTMGDTKGCPISTAVCVALIFLLAFGGVLFVSQGPSHRPNVVPRTASNLHLEDVWMDTIAPPRSPPGSTIKPILGMKCKHHGSTNIHRVPKSWDNMRWVSGADVLGWDPYSVELEGKTLRGELARGRALSVLHTVQTKLSSKESPAKVMAGLIRHYPRKGTTADLEGLDRSIRDILALVKSQCGGYTPEDIVVTFNAMSFLELRESNAMIALGSRDLFKSVMQSLANIALKKKTMQAFSPREVITVLWCSGSTYANLENLRRVLYRSLSYQVLANLNTAEMTFLMQTMATFSPSNDDILLLVSRKLTDTQILDLMQAHHVAAITWSWAMLQSRHEAMLASIADRALTFANSFNTRELTMTMWAFATLNYTDQPMIKALSKQAVSQSWTDIEEIATLAWSLTTLDIRNPKLMDHLANQMKKSHMLMDISNCFLEVLAWSYSRVPGQHDFINMLANSAVMGYSKPNTMIILLESLSVAGLARKDVFKAFAKSLNNTDYISDFDANELAVIVWSFAAMGITETDLLKDIMTEMVTRNLISKSNIHSIADFVWGVAKLDIDNNYIKTTIALLAKEAAHSDVIQEATAEDLGALLWGATKLQVHTDELITKAASQTIALGTQVKASTLTYIIAANGVAQTTNKEFLTYAAEYARQPHMINTITPQDMPALLQGFARVDWLCPDLMHAIGRRMLSPSFIEDMTPEGVVQTVTSYATLGMARRDVMQVLAKRLAHPSLLGTVPIDFVIANILEPYAFLNIRYKPFMKAICKKFMSGNTMQFISANSISRSAAAFSKLNWKDAAVMTALSNRALQPEVLKSHSGDEAGTIVGAYIQLGIYDRPLIREMIQRVEDPSLLQGLHGNTLIQILEGLVKMRHDGETTSGLEGVKLREKIGNIILRSDLLGKLDVQELIRIVTAYGDLGFRDWVIFTKAGQRLMDREIKSQLGIQEIADLVYIYSAMGVGPPDLYKYLASIAKQSSVMKEATHSDLARIAHSYTLVAINPPGLICAVIKRAKQQEVIDTLTALDVARILAALAHIPCSHSKCCGDIESFVQVTKKPDYFDNSPASTLSSLLKAYAALDLKDPTILEPLVAALMKGDLLESCTGDDFSNLLNAYVVLELEDNELLHRVQTLMQRHSSLHAMSMNAFVLALSSLTRIPPELREHELVACMAAKAGTPEVMGQYTPSHLPATLSALAKLGFGGDSLVIHTLEDHIPEVAAFFDAKAITLTSQTLIGLHRLSYNTRTPGVDPRIFDAMDMIAKRTVSVLPTMTGPQCAIMLESLALMNMGRPQMLRALALHIVRHNIMDQLELDDTVRIVKALAWLDTPQEELLRGIAIRMAKSKQLKELTHMEVAMIVETYAHFKVSHTKQLEQLAAVIMDGEFQPTLGPSDLTSLLSGYADLNYGSTSFYTTLVNRIDNPDVIMDLKDTQIATILRIIAEKDINAPELIIKLTQRLLDYEIYAAMGANVLNMTCWACGKLGINETNLFPMLVKRAVELSSHGSKVQFASTLLYAMALSKKHVPMSLLRQMVDVVTKKEMLSNMLPADMVKIAWSYATMMFRHDQLMEQLAGELIRVMPELEGREAADVAWAYAALDIPHQPLFESLAHRLTNSTPTTDPLVSQLPSVYAIQAAWAFAALDMKDDGLTRALLRRVGTPKLGYSVAVLTQYQQIQMQIELNSESYPKAAAYVKKHPATTKGITPIYLACSEDLIEDVKRVVALKGKNASYQIVTKDAGSYEFQILVEDTKTVIEAADEAMMLTVNAPGTHEPSGYLKVRARHIMKYGYKVKGISGAWWHSLRSDKLKGNYILALLNSPWDKSW